jgi:hypothetical protein
MSPKDVRLVGEEIGPELHRLNRGSSYPEIRMPVCVQAATIQNL